MKKFIPFFIITMIIMPATATTNPMFADGTRNSLSIHVAQGTGSGTLFKLINPFQWDFWSMTMVMGTYSQPVEIFRLPARINLNVAQNFGYRSSKGLSFSGVGVSWDIVPFCWRGFYAGLGAGPYMRDVRDRWVNSRLVFGEKVFIGKNISERVRAELFTLHFSNGDFTRVNKGFNFVGISISYSY